MYNNGYNAYKNNSVNYASKEQLLLIELDTEDKNDTNKSQKYITVEGTLENTKKITIDAAREENYIERVPIGNVIDSVK